jgi:hypothetical protein
MVALDMNDDATAMLVLLPIGGLMFLALAAGVFLVIRPYRRPRPRDPDDRIKPPGRISKDHPDET